MTDLERLHAKVLEVARLKADRAQAMREWGARIAAAQADVDALAASIEAGQRELFGCEPAANGL